MIQLSPRDGVALQRDNRKADALGSIFQLFSGPSHLYWVLQSKPMTKTLPLPYLTSFLSGPLLKKPRYPLLFLELIDFTHNSLTRCLSACLSCLLSHDLPACRLFLSTANVVEGIHPVSLSSCIWVQITALQVYGVFVVLFHLCLSSFWYNENLGLGQ